MNLADKIELFDGIDEKLIQEAMPRRLLKYGASRNAPIYDSKNSVFAFIESVASVAIVALVVGGLFIWTLVGKDLLRVENSGDSESSVTSEQENVTSEQENDDKPISAYSEGLELERNKRDDGYKVVGIGTCKDTVINIPPTYNGWPVTEIGVYAFKEQSNIVEVIIPNTVESIENEAFRNCSSLEKVTIADSVCKIGSYVFADCDSLTEIRIPEGLTYIECMFSGCDALKTVELPSSLEAISWKMFEDCISLETIIIPNGVKRIETAAFEGCSLLKEITIPSSVLSIGPRAFENCVLLEKVTLNEGLEYIYDSTFARCGRLANFIIPKSVKHIESLAFFYCESLTEMTIPEGVTYFQPGAFNYCTNLKNLVINANIQTFSGSFLSCDNLESITLGEGIKEIGGMTIYELTGLKKVVLPSTITYIGKSNFEKCDDLEIVYNGTVAQWQAIEKEFYDTINVKVPISCSDGVTYTK